MIGFLLALAISASAATHRDPVSVKPKMTPPAYVTPQYGFTLRTPAGSTYCPLPKDWSGADHGTVIFLVPPKECAGTAFSSSAHGFAPDNVPRIEIFYSYWMGDDEPPAASPPCKSLESTILLGKLEPLCSDMRKGEATVVAEVRYKADIESQASFALVTTPERLQNDLFIFKQVMKSAQTCSSRFYVEDLKGKRQGKAFFIGQGAPCPKDAKWF